MPQDTGSEFGSSSVAPARFNPLGVAGFAATLAGLLILAAIIAANIGCENRGLPHQVDDTRVALAKAGRTIEQYRIEHNALPSTRQGQLLIAGLHDGWGRSFQYSLADDARDYDLRSAGPDGAFGNIDDILLEKPDEPLALPNSATVAPGEAFTFSLTAEGAVTIEGKALTDEQLTERLREWGRSHPHGSVLIDYPNSTPTERVLQVYTICGELKLIPARAPLKLPTTRPAR